MAAIPVKPEIAAAVVTDWRIGKMSQRQLSKEYGVSLGTVSKLCKGVEQDGVAIVNTGVQYQQALAGHNERMVNAIEHAVDERTKHILFFNGAALQNVTEAMAAECKDQTDYKYRAETINKGRETVLGKDPTTAVQINDNSTEGGKWVIEVPGLG